MREIKFRVWDGDRYVYPNLIGWYGDVCTCWHDDGFLDTKELEQFTGLHDKNGLTDIYEGDIVSITGEVNGNIHERHDKRSTDIVITGMGTKSWRDTEQEASRRGCFYAE